jgi:hypothetical protein
MEIPEQYRRTTALFREGNKMVASSLYSRRRTRYTNLILGLGTDSAI